MLEYNKKEIFYKIVYQYNKSQICFVYNLTFLYMLLAKNMGNYFLGNFYEVTIRH